jgi:hypothetical protein
MLFQLQLFIHCSLKPLIYSTPLSYFHEELHGLYSSPGIVRVIKARRMRWVGHVARMGEVRGAYILIGRPEGRRPLGRPRRRWEDNIKMDLREIGFGVWIGFIGLRIGTGGGLL